MLNSPIQQQFYSVLFMHEWTLMYICACLVETSLHQLFCSVRRHYFWHTVQCSSVKTGQLFDRDFRPLVATAEVVERCKVQQGSVRWCGAGWVIPPTSLYSCCPEGRCHCSSAKLHESVREWGWDVDLSPFNQLILCFCCSLIYAETFCRWPLSYNTWWTTPTRMGRQKLILLIF